MSKPEQPATPALTRKHLREIRNTGAIPIVSVDGPADDLDARSAEQDAALEIKPAAASALAPLPRAAVPAVIHDPPAPDASIRLDVAPLTRRQARQQEQIRTASVPVITPAFAAAHAASGARGTEQRHSSLDEDEPVVYLEQIIDDSPADRAVVGPEFGANLLAGETAAVEHPASFDQLISRSTTGSIGTGNALILSEAPSSAPLGAPVTATGEVLITGTFDLPEGLGSTGRAAGTADGKEVDAILVDGELPAHSSPTPIAASAAISTVKNGAEIIKPPAPEKGGRLMLTLAITAGVLAIALVGVLILAFVTGVF